MYTINLFAGIATLIFLIMTSELNKKDIKELTKELLVSWLEDRKIRSFRAKQILKWIYLRQEDSFDSMTDLRKDIRKLLSLHFTIKRLEKMEIKTSHDGSRKYLFKLKDGKYIESILIPEKDHYTLCVSTQVGCAQGCSFCLTAKGGFVRNLTKGEIVSQVRDIQNDLCGSKRLTNIVFMGMGEPLANYKNLIDAVNIIIDNDYGLNFAGRKVTMSTAGLVPKIIDFGRDTKVNIAISLNATDNKTRSMLMPINRKYPIEKLLDACRRYNLQPGRRITFEYILMKDINDSEKDAYRLAKLLGSIKSKINLIPFNEYDGCTFLRPEESVVQHFQEILLKKNYTVIIRHSKGQDISAACGQLSANLMPDT